MEHWRVPLRAATHCRLELHSCRRHLGSGTESSFPARKLSSLVVCSSFNSPPPQSHLNWPNCIIDTNLFKSLALVSWFPFLSPPLLSHRSLSQSLLPFIPALNTQLENALERSCLAKTDSGDFGLRSDQSEPREESSEAAGRPSVTPFAEEIQSESPDDAI